MWIRNQDTSLWTPKVDTLSTSSFDLLKQDLKSLRFYQKVLSGALFSQVTNINNIYDVLTRQIPKTYYYNNQFSQYVKPYLGSVAEPALISSTSSQFNFLNEHLLEYGQTLKTLFTPKRLISDQIQNLHYVDIATSDRIEDLTIVDKTLTIDGIRLKNGHRILVKDQKTLITLSENQFTFDENDEYPSPLLYFEQNYNVDSTFITSPDIGEVGSPELIQTENTFLIYNSENGIYEFQDGRLIRTSDLDDYKSLINFTVCVKLGSNSERQFTLQRLLDGTFAQYQNGEPIFFSESKNYVLRNRMDYNNLYELVLNDTLKHGTQSVTIKDIIYTIPERTITVGEFGSIIVHQEGFSNFINNKYKTTLRSISQTNDYYWICGDDGYLLRVSKVDFSIKRSILQETTITKDFEGFDQELTTKVDTSLNSISFSNNLRGVVVGKFNQIWITNDSGDNWSRIFVTDFEGFNFNSVIYLKIDKFYVGGDNGVFIEFGYGDGSWVAYRRRISQFRNTDEEYLLVDDIRDLNYFIDNSGFFAGTASFIAIGAENGYLFLYDLDGSINALRSVNYDFYYVGGSATSSNICSVCEVKYSWVDNEFGDIQSVSYQESNSKLIFNTFNSVFQVSPFSGTYSSTSSNILAVDCVNYYTQSGVNSIYSYDGETIITGINSLWKNIIEVGASTTASNVYHESFFTDLKPRLLFMDYDAGSKLYWFDDFGQYRLPERIYVPVSYLVDSTATTQSFIDFRENSNTIYDGNTGLTSSYFETNWITYWKDRMKTFEYHTHLDDSYKVEPSFRFESSNSLSGIFTYTASNITTNFGDIQNLMPVTSENESRYRDSGNPIVLSNPTHNLYFYKFLGIWAITVGASEEPPKKGDVIEIECPIFKGKFIVNKVLSYTDGTTTHYQYFYTDFNENILNNLNAFSGELKIKNLNKYATTKGGIKSFSATYSTSGYSQGSYKGVSGDNRSSFDIDVNAIGQITSIVINKPGFGFNTGDSFNIPSGGMFGGTVDITITITEVDYNSEFIENFKSHYISYAYDIETVSTNFTVPTSNPIGVTQSFQITGKYNRYSAYYNLQANIEILTTQNFLVETDIRYQSSFLNFGYSPTYNLLSYLNFLDNKKYLPGKEILSLPSYEDIPGPDSGFADTTTTNDNLIYMDFVLGEYSGIIETNKLYFGLNLKHLWDSLLKWTFVDLVLKVGGWPAPVGAEEFRTNRLLIIDKYQEGDYYVLVFHDKFSGNNSITSVSIFSRRTLQQISDDLQYINRLQRPLEDKEGNAWSIKNIETGFYYTNYETDIGYKISTDSYTKVLLSDADIIRDLSGIVYTDYKFELAIQIIKLEQEFNLIPSNVSPSINNKYQLSVSSKHNLKNGEGIVVQCTSTQSNWPQILGYRSPKVLDDYNLEIDVNWDGFLPIDPLNIFIIKKDPFLNFQPCDLFDLGVGDKLVKQSIEISPDNYEIESNKYFLINVDPNKYRFRLIDGLDLVRLTEQFYWILDAEVSDAIIGLDSSNNLVWYRGSWEGGRWFNGTWISGTWKSGDWYGGVWTSKNITDKKLSVKIDPRVTNTSSSKWYGGRWFGGTWENGSWYTGRWYDGNWLTGRWYDGTWNDGTWNDGRFSGGIWVRGSWKNGLFNTDSKRSFWLDGSWFGGDFENGIWYNGTFNSPNKLSISRFGTKSFSTRKSIWHSGNFIRGEFHSYLNLNDSGFPDISENHSYSIWNTGKFRGSFYGGTVNNIEFDSSIWYGGVLKDISIVRIDTTTNSFTLDGVYRFNINDKFYIMDNLTSSTYSVFGSTNNPVEYRVLDTTIDEENNITEVIVEKLLSDIYGFSLDTGVIETQLKLVSKFKNSTWRSGVWKNGFFDNGRFLNGIWYDGYFSGAWG